MKTSSKRIGLSALMFLFSGVPLSLGGEALIAPTRSLEGPWEPVGELTVVSEPPGLGVFLDGSEIGQTPVWMKQVKRGPHTLRVRCSKTVVYVETGEMLTLSFFKGSFIVVPDKKEALERPEPEKPREGRKRMKPREQEGEMEDLTPWERFLIFTPSHF